MTNSGLEALVLFGHSTPGLLLVGVGQAMVVVCVAFDLVRALSVPRSHRRFVAATIFRTLAVPSIAVTAVGVLIDVASKSWLNVTLGTFLMVALIFRWHHDKDEDHWWKGKGKKLARWARRLAGPRWVPSPARG